MEGHDVGCKGGGVSLKGETGCAVFDTRCKEAKMQL